MLKLLIVDDEPVVRDGLKCIIPWVQYGFSVCGEAGDGEEGLKKILDLSPDLVLVDIKMPGMPGIEMLEEARKKSFVGKVIILTGFSDFNYAKNSIRLGVVEYLLKPIDEVELANAAKRAAMEIEEEQKAKSALIESREQIRHKILLDTLLHNGEPLETDSTLLCDYGLSGDLFQVAVIKYSFAVSILAEEECVGTISYQEECCRERNIEVLKLEEKIVLVAKGKEAVNYLSVCVKQLLKNLQSPKGASGNFAAVGRPVLCFSDLRLSYEDANKLLKRQFYCGNEEVVFWNQQKQDYDAEHLKSLHYESYIERLYSCIEAGNTRLMREIFNEMEDSFRNMDISQEKVIGLLINISIKLKERVLETYKTIEKAVPDDNEIVHNICTRFSLCEITDSLYKSFCDITAAVANLSGDIVFKRIIRYIDHHYADDLKLESLAKLFCYNSAYLGKLFKRKTRQSFNHYLDGIRIENAKRLLSETDLKVYQISEKVGINNINYFYCKFKKFTGLSPREYINSIKQAKEA